MIGLIELLIMLVVVGYCAYQRLAMKNAMLINGVALVVLLFTLDNSWGFYVSLVIYGIVSLFYFLPDLRVDWISRKLYHFMQQVLPPMTETEKTALEAGDVLWEGELFRGKPDWSTLLNYKKPELTEEEQSLAPPSCNRSI